ncbi:S-adenosyl-L-methionine-dependent methyltransferase [Auriscalpium vulgare]|uniref:S-adenosyl-L-methionine-dependent methyltransferase n=1 Tax=Auriscalpium vulgare TaxID=40419 RepID=A0ACB8S9J7_9AGAM|nr:S-adenosyl-L-methionine-dependent methyltransferase [Auriscalpium vulgare]
MPVADPLRQLPALGPPQPPSVHNELLHILVPVPHNRPDIALRLAVDAAPGCGGIAWPAGEVLARYLARHRGPPSLAGARVLELGSGTGLVGLIAARLGAHVWITDQPPLLPIMANNIRINDLAPQVTAAELNWGEPLPCSIPQTFDFVLAADCVYFEPAFPLLVATLCALVPTSSPGPEVLFCYKKRRKADKRFFALLKKHFTWTDVDDASDPERQSYSREAISLLRLRRRPGSVASPISKA